MCELITGVVTRSTEGRSNAEGTREENPVGGQRTDTALQLLFVLLPMLLLDRMFL